LLLQVERDREKEKNLLTHIYIKLPFSRTDITI
jgi:hypothetical protein